jgi:hypothetical protein
LPAFTRELGQLILIPRYSCDPLSHIFRKSIALLPEPVVLARLEVQLALPAPEERASNNPNHPALGELVKLPPFWNASEKETARHRTIPVTVGPQTCGIPMKSLASIAILVR